jgi:hypothetical protein
VAELFVLSIFCHPYHAIQFESSTQNIRKPSGYGKMESIVYPNLSGAQIFFINIKSIGTNIY